MGDHLSRWERRSILCSETMSKLASDIPPVSHLTVISILAKINE